MIISHKYKFIFIKTMKTAGTSIEAYLSNFCGEEDIVTPIFPHVEPHQPRNSEGYYNHMPAYAVKERVGSNIWDTYFTFCVERNPWEKSISYYLMWNAKRGGGFSFDDYLASGEHCVNYPMYTDPQNTGKIIVDKIISYENLHDELNEVFSHLNIPFEQGLNIWAKSENRTDGKSRRHTLSNEQAAIIEKMFAHEIAHFGYKF